ncbi:hypothetical protein HX017_02350 [Myroides marinus]|jgi:hypothetical protein|uniref:Uncharacterized protein n=1 Tax=Myroides marinus TaxID=703342 RepID=A0A165QJV6_9FLAO|nr:hypothetical protein [Myroides marinus]MDR0194770.1 hypothetical protein [Myroides sp.]KZE75319.1 hypothetical protein AV926_17040 [Myroides marinus]MDM1348492.1 hypothetical protein [Myroides marinus]MDM1349440.1 hypothetical protein [Myroides marinus]MDM1355616.1 hypothetical protein [Myroides marinus]
MQKDTKRQQKKPCYPVSDDLVRYLDKYKRTTKTSILYEDLLRFSGYISVEDKFGNDTLWLRVYYPEHEYAEIESSLTKIYTLLHSDGDVNTLQHLTVDSIDFCSFGNSQPFRVKVRNKLNDIYTNFYIKKADASRIYGLELEEMLSPYTMNYIVHKDTLIEEHIMGIPGDVFIKEHLAQCSELEKSQIAKEYVKFNERCLIGLLGDMRSYNYVIIPTHDFDHVVYRIRPIDFDQQCYEGNLKFYLPQFFKENNVIVRLVIEKFKDTSIEQYRKEIRSVLVRRVLSNKERLEDLLNVMKHDTVAPQEHVNQLKTDLYDYVHEKAFKYCDNMGEVLETAIDFTIKNYRSVF